MFSDLSKDYNDDDDAWVEKCPEGIGMDHAAADADNKVLVNGDNNAVHNRYVSIPRNTMSEESSCFRMCKDLSLDNQTPTIDIMNNVETEPSEITVTSAKQEMESYKSFI